ncbi:MAG: hypothetical protein ACREIT_09625 [Tepidisphaeraceae bacterium]
MPVWLQHLLVGLIVTGALVFVAWQTARTLWGKHGKVGRCCAKGCASEATPTGAKIPPERVVFMPVEMLGRKR